MKNFFKYIFPWMVYVGLMFYLSSLQMKPSAGIGDTSLDWNSLLHIVEYFGLSLLTYRLFLHFQFGKTVLFAILFSILFGILDEVHQSFVPTRIFSLLDFVFDIMGSLSLLLFLKSDLLKKWLE